MDLKGRLGEITGRLRILKKKRCLRKLIVETLNPIFISHVAVMLAKDENSEVAHQIGWKV
jgi:hypothetical protein